MSRRLTLTLVLLAAVLVAGFAPGTAQANGCPLRFSQGTSGTTADPIRIETVADLNVLRTSGSCYASGYVFLQTTDLALTGTVAPIGTVGNPFNGTYDGGGHVITGLHVDNTTAGSYKGLFAAISAGTVRDLTLRGASIIGTVWYYGVLTGLASNGTVIERVSVIDSSVASSGYGSEYMGGIAGALSNSTVRDARVSGLSVAIAVTNDYIGGIAGELFGGAAILRSSADVSITGAGSYVGGLAGLIYGAGTITDSYATGSVSGTYRVGGLLGAYFTGGGPITRSYSTVRVSATGAGTAGGFVGDVMASPPAASAVASFWDTQTSTQAASANGATGKTSEQLKSASTFVDAGWSIGTVWDASHTWTICARANGGYPFLNGAFNAATDPCTAPPESPAATSASTASAAAVPVTTVHAGSARVTGNTIRTTVTVSGAGAVRQTAGVLPVQPKRRLEAAIEAEERSARPIGRATLMVACRDDARLKAAGSVALACTLNARTLNLAERRGLIVRLITTFLPTGGKAVSTATTVAIPRRAERPAGGTTVSVTG